MRAHHVHARFVLQHAKLSTRVPLFSSSFALRSPSAAEVLISNPAERAAFLARADWAAANVSVVIENVDEVVRAQKAARVGDGWRPRPANSTADRAARRDEYFSEYRRLSVIHEYLDLLAAEHPDRATLIPNLGDSHEGNRIPVSCECPVGDPRLGPHASACFLSWPVAPAPPPNAASFGRGRPSRSVGSRAAQPSCGRAARTAGSGSATRPSCG